MATLNGKSVILGVNYGEILDRNVVPKHSYESDRPNNLPFDPKHFVGVAISIDSPTLRSSHDRLKAELMVSLCEAMLQQW